MRLAVLLAGGAVIVGALAFIVLVLISRRESRLRDHADALIKKPKVRFEGHDDKLRIDSQRRRAAADDIRKEAQAVESGLDPAVQELRASLRASLRAGTGPRRLAS